MPTDKLERPLQELRISVTDRCSFRCVYCMPREIYDDHEYLPRAEILTYDEITRIASIVAGMGVRKVRLTGGEPLLRRELSRLVESLVAIDGIDDVALTTNGLLLADQTADLAKAGLSRVTVSLDGLDDDVVRRIIDTDVPVSTVLNAIDVAAAAGLGPIKVNTVVRRGWNDDQVLGLVEYFRGTDHVIRFIEYMDVGTSNEWQSAEVVPTAELIELIDSRWAMEPMHRSHQSEVATSYRFNDGQGRVGFISSISEPFCGDCSRLRLSAEGAIYTCLFATEGVDLKGALRSGATDIELAARIAGTWSGREDRYSELRGGVALGLPKIEMSYIGG